MDDDKMIDVETTRSRWTTRRLMTWFTLFFFFSTVYLGFFYVKPADLVNYSTLFNIIAFFCTGVVGSYFGFATYDDIKNIGVSRRTKKTRSREVETEVNSTDVTESDNRN